MSDPFPRGSHPCASGPIPQPKDEEIDLAPFNEAVHRLNTKRGVFKLILGFDVLIVLIFNLQLALRHPSNTGQMAQEIREVAEGIIDTIAGEEPDLAKLLRMGFDPQYDRGVSVTPLPKGGA